MNKNNEVYVVQSTRIDYREKGINKFQSSEPGVYFYKEALDKRLEKFEPMYNNKDVWTLLEVWSYTYPRDIWEDSHHYTKKKILQKEYHGKELVKTERF